MKKCFFFQIKVTRIINKNECLSFYSILHSILHVHEARIEFLVYCFVLYLELGIWLCKYTHIVEKRISIWSNALKAHFIYKRKIHKLKSVRCFVLSKFQDHGLHWFDVNQKCRCSSFGFITFAGKRRKRGRSVKKKAEDTEVKERPIAVTIRNPPQDLCKAAT